MLAPAPEPAPLVAPVVVDPDIAGDEPLPAAVVPPVQASAASSVDRPVEGVTDTSWTVPSPIAATTPSASPVIATIMQVDEADAAVDAEPEMPAMVAVYDALVERPSVVEEASFHSAVSADLGNS